MGEIPSFLYSHLRENIPQTGGSSSTNPSCLHTRALKNGGWVIGNPTIQWSTDVYSGHAYPKHPQIYSHQVCKFCSGLNSV